MTESGKRAVDLPENARTAHVPEIAGLVPVAKATCGSLSGHPAQIRRLGPMSVIGDYTSKCRRHRWSNGTLDQIQFLLGHVSVQTTERYLGCKQHLRNAVNDRIGIEPRF